MSELGPVAQLIAELALCGLLTRRCETHPDDPSLDYVSTLAWTGLMVRRSDLSPGRITLLRLDDGTPWRWAVDTSDDRLLIPYDLESAIGGAS